MKNELSNLNMNINVLNKAMSNSLKSTLISNGINDLNESHVLILKNIGIDGAGVNQAINRGYNVGTNISYGLRLLEKNGYVRRDENYCDKRTVKLSLTQKGLEILALLDSVIMSQVKELTDCGVTCDDIKNINYIINKINKII